MPWWRWWLWGLDIAFQLWYPIKDKGGSMRTAYVLVTDDDGTVYKVEIEYTRTTETGTGYGTGLNRRIIYEMVSVKAEDGAPAWVADRAADKFAYFPERYID